MESLAEGAERLRIRLTPEQLESFATYREELASARPRAGLTALTDPEAIQRRHFLEPLALLVALEAEAPLPSPAIDIGAGAGFPGLPIKIVRPRLKLTLLEANAKRARFLEGVARRLALEGVTVVNGRAEEAAHDPGQRETYGLALARAVAPLPVLAELALPFLRPGGLLAAAKGSGAPREVREAAAALEACGGRVESVAPMSSPRAETPPILVLVRKVSPTPARFPRRPGIPSKRPLR